jgi:hypothetical protein
MKNKTTKMFIGILVLGAILISFISFASAESLACFDDGEKYTYCGDAQERISKYESNCGLSYCTCQHTLCKVCIISYNQAQNCYVPGNSNVCLRITPTCSSGGGGGGPGEIDLTPPVFSISSPVKNTIYNTKKIFLNFSLNEYADVYYRDVNKSTSTISWTKVCDNCAPGEKSYAKIRSFAEGNNKLMFKAVDSKNNEAQVNLSFFIDSTKPRIYTTYPRANAFADGNFEVQFKEVNPKKLTLHYGTDTADVDLDDCYYAMGKQNCEVDVDLNKYNGQTIGYYFELEDIAGNKYSSRLTSVKVDTKAPVLNNPTSFYTIVDKRYVVFNLSITENNFYKATFVNTLNPRATPSTLCTRLTAAPTGYCYKKQSFTEGTYSLSIEITDKAGHSIAVPASFTIDY